MVIYYSTKMTVVGRDVDVKSIQFDMLINACKYGDNCPDIRHTMFNLFTR